MIALWWSKISKYVIFIGGALLAVLAALAYGRKKGSDAATSAAADKADAVQARQEAATATVKADNAEVRHDVETEIRAQPVSPSVPNPSADKLHDSWSRD